jgi:amylosucrase
VQNVYAMRPEVRAEFAEVRARLEGDATFLTRLERFFTELRDPLVALYGRHPAFRQQFGALLEAMAAAARDRDPDLRRLDHEREITPDWLQREQGVGYVCYVDRFAGTLAGVRERLPYLHDLGVNYLHLMPLLAARPEPNDGGYAVADYGAIEPSLGTMDDLRALAADLHAHGMALCIDVVLNHTAREHAWARAALEGDERKLAYYLTFPDRAEPDAYERTLHEVFPDIAPGNFTWVPELGRWVWTTFNEYQWDLDYSNPEVFRAMAQVVLDLAAVGIDVLRLDAVPFLWKRMGTDCQNQPEVHQLLQALRAVARIAAPAVGFKAEAIVSPADLITYLGTGRHEGKECDLAYNNVLMALLWSALASGRVALMTHVLDRMPAVPPGAGWVTYVRCHDDIGWTITPEDAAAVGEDAHLHRRFLSDFYAGDFPLSFGRGARFQQDELTGEARTSGTAASLAGLESALSSGDEVARELAIRRLLMLYAVAFGHGGLPLIYMGDELGLLNDPAWAADERHRGDNRWMHRPPMDWAAAERRHVEGSVEAALWEGLRRLASARRATRATHAHGTGQPLRTGNDHVYGLLRTFGGERLLVLANFSADEQSVRAAIVDEHGMRLTASAATPDGRSLRTDDEHVILAPYQFVWIRDQNW